MYRHSLRQYSVSLTCCGLPDSTVAGPASWCEGQESISVNLKPSGDQAAVASGLKAMSKDTKAARVSSEARFLPPDSSLHPSTPRLTDTPLCLMFNFASRLLGSKQVAAPRPRSPEPSQEVELLDWDIPQRQVPGRFTQQVNIFYDYTGRKCVHAAQLQSLRRRRLSAVLASSISSFASVLSC